MTDAAGRIDDLVTVRDWLRYALSRFNAAGLAYGHGTSRAIDDAAFIVLATLELPPDELDPWLDARLTRPERRRLDAVIEARVTSRKPAPYLVGHAYIRGRRFLCDERAIVPRSFLGELLCDRMDEAEELFPPFMPEQPIARILELCTGGGSLAILAALAFEAATVDAIDVSADALALARDNIAACDLGDRVRLLEGDLYAPVTGARYDLILANPPYVTEAAVAAFPPEHRAEPALAHRGGVDGLDLVRRIIDGAAAHLSPGGQIVIEVGTGRAALEAAYPGLPFVWLDTAASEGEVVALAASAFTVDRIIPRRRKSGLA